jgi:hypothetical protein
VVELACLTPWQHGNLWRGTDAGVVPDIRLDRALEIHLVVEFLYGFLRRVAALSL